MDALFYRGDDLLAQLRPARGIGVIKIDVEGAESEVIEGLRRTIATDRPLMYCEISGAFATASEARRKATEKLWNLLHTLGYRVLGVLWDATLQEVRELADLKEPYNGEYILAHAGDVPALMKAFESERGIPIRRRK